MVVARQQPSWVSERNSYLASFYSAQQASQTTSAQYDDDGQKYGGSKTDDDDDLASAFSTTTDLAFGSTTATLEGGAIATMTASSSGTQTSTGGNLASPAVSSTAAAQATPTPSMTTSISWTQPAWRPGWHSYSPSYIRTGTTSETSAATLAPSLETQQKSHHGTNATIIAGVVIPVAILLASGLTILTCLRKRRARAAASAAPTASDAVAATPMVEKVVGKKLEPAGIPPPTSTTTMLSPIDEAMVSPQRPQLVITSPQNPTYFTGLDTFSIHSAGTSEDPPPPYRARSVLSHTSSERRQHSVVTHQPTLAPISPVSPVAHLSSPFSDANAVGVTRSPSQRSFASTLYSSNASVYEARPARRSIGPAEYVISRRSSTEDQGRVRSPFEDPADGSDDENHERQ